MKTITKQLALLFLAVNLLSACGKDPIPPPSSPPAPFTQFVEYDLDGVHDECLIDTLKMNAQMEGDNLAINVKSAGHDLYMHVERVLQADTFTVKKVHQGLQTLCKVDNNTSSMCSMSAYDTLPVYNGRITITTFDKESKVVSGTFYFDVCDGVGTYKKITNGEFALRLNY